MWKYRGSDVLFSGLRKCTVTSDIKLLQIKQLLTMTYSQ